MLGEESGTESGNCDENNGDGTLQVAVMGGGAWVTVMCSGAWVRWCYGACTVLGDAWWKRVVRSCATELDSGEGDSDSSGVGCGDRGEAWEQ